MSTGTKPRRAGGTHVVPAQWRSDVAEVLITETHLRQRVGELARAITRDYVGKDLVVVALLTGTIMFLADLIRRLSLPLRLDFIRASSYHHGTVARQLTFTKDLRLEIRGRDVLVVDDICDTGRTLASVLARLAALKPRSLKTCVLLDKPARRVVPVTSDYVGFVVPDVYVIGYGLDYGERYRNLPFVGVLHPELCAPPSPSAA